MFFHNILGLNLEVLRFSQDRQIRKRKLISVFWYNKLLDSFAENLFWGADSF